MPRSDQKIGSAPSLSGNLDLQPELGVAIAGRGRGKGRVCISSFFGIPAQTSELEIVAAPMGVLGASRWPAWSIGQAWRGFCQQQIPGSLGSVVLPLLGSSS